MLTTWSKFKSEVEDSNSTKCFNQDEVIICNEEIRMKMPISYAENC